MDRRSHLIVAAILLAAAASACDPDSTSPVTPSALRAAPVRVGNLFRFPDPSGTIATYSTNGSLDGGNPFFQSLGTNGRSCASCHLASDAFGLSAASARAVFASSGGADPLFAAVDGANCPNAAPQDAAARSLLLNNGLFRVAIAVPAGAQFSIAAVHDPYGCALSVDANGVVTVSMYRRPLPSTNLRFLSAVMFDGRETVMPLTTQASFEANLRANLAHQAVDATLGHAQAAVPPSSAQVNGIVDFELALFSAQASDAEAGVLNAEGADGGPLALAEQAYYPGINDPLGDNPTGVAFDPQSFTIFKDWLAGGNGRYAEARAAVARGAVIFNTHPLAITGVNGLNDALGAPSIPGTCSTCHDSPNVGNHSRPVPLDIGTSHASAFESDAQVAAALGELSMPDLPVFRVTCTAGPLAGSVSYTSDPAKALLSGLCADIGRGKGPILRGLAARAPYFHNGAAATLDQVVAFYNRRFQMGLSAQDRADLAAFLRAL